MSTFDSQWLKRWACNPHALGTNPIQVVSDDRKSRGVK